MKKFCLLLATLLVCQIATACDSQSVTDETTPDINETTLDEPYVYTLFDGLPDKDFEGKEFRILVREHLVNEFLPETQTGDVLNDALYKRTETVEDRFGVRIVYTPIGGRWGNRSEFTTTVRSSVMSGSGDFDLIEANSAYVGDLFGENIFENLHEINYLRLNESWWSELIVDKLTVNGKIYAITGDISMTLFDYLHVIFFNKDLMDQYNLVYPYEMVRNGTWTIDKLLEMIKDKGANLDGAESDRKYGMTIWDSLSMDNLLTAFGIPRTKTDTDGKIEFDVVNDRTVAVWEIANSLWRGNPDVNLTGGDKYTDALKKFSDGQSIFHMTWLTDAKSLRDKTIDYGILPYPKYDENQENYYTGARDGHSMFCIPIDASDKDFSGLITEAICEASAMYVRPAYIEKTLNSKLARDEDTVEMLGIIRETATIEFALEYAIQNDYGGMALRQSVLSGTPITTWWAQHESSCEKAFEEFMKVYYSN